MKKMSAEAKKSKVETITNPSLTEIPQYTEIEEKQEDFSLAWEVIKTVNSSASSAERTNATMWLFAKQVLFALIGIIVILIAFIAWQDYQNKQLITDMTEIHTEQLESAQNQLSDFLSEFDELIYEETTEVEQDTEGGNNSFIGGNVNGETVGEDQEENNT